MSLLISVIISAWIPQVHEDTDAARASQWEQYTMMQKKAQQLDSEWQQAQAFLDNHKKAAEANALNRKLGLDLRFAMNEFADQTFESFASTHLGQGQNVHSFANPMPKTSFSVSDAPATLDWRDKNVINAVKNQGSCGSCWAFSTMGSLEPRWALKSGTLLDLAEQQLVDCDRAGGSDGDQGCNGGLMDNAFTQLKSAGAEETKNQKQQGTDGTCQQNKSLVRVTPTGFTDVEKSDEGLLEALQSGPVSIAVDANTWWQLQFGGILHQTQCSGTSLNHGVTLVGQDADSWIVRNSWGPSWGEKG